MAKDIKRYNTTLRNLEYRLRAFKDNIPKYLGDIIKDKEDVILEAITENQLYKHGITGTGQKIWDYAPYTASTIKRKIKKGQPSNRVTLRDTGKFHKSMFLVIDSEGFYVTSDSTIAPYLIKKYGDEIFRLTDENLTRIIREHIRTELTNRIKQVIKK